eukprot:TRINITY_DN17743_c0_g1_i2.p1 TRINITY_DN17743_c0_g1~~TRINITY_DN17743_c0_g1_i2.p1  ORF type:complete len:227 (+),score=-7.61 TRINITY_DN17743_c0_g1_i2:566-1246(+)
MKTLRVLIQKSEYKILFVPKAFIPLQANELSFSIKRTIIVTLTFQKENHLKEIKFQYYLKLSKCLLYQMQSKQVLKNQSPVALRATGSPLRGESKSNYGENRVAKIKTPDVCIQHTPNLFAMCNRVQLKASSTPSNLSETPNRRYRRHLVFDQLPMLLRRNLMGIKCWSQANPTWQCSLVRRSYKISQRQTSNILKGGRQTTSTSLIGKCTVNSKFEAHNSSSDSS